MQQLLALLHALAGTNLGHAQLYLAEIIKADLFLMVADQLSAGSSGFGFRLLCGGVGSLGSGFLGSLQGIQFGQLLGGVDAREDVLALVQGGIGRHRTHGSGAVPGLQAVIHAQLGKDLFAGGRHKRLQQHGADAQGLGQVIQHTGQAGLGVLALGQHPGGGSVDVLVGVVDDLKHVGQSILESISLHVGLVAGAQTADFFQQGGILGPFVLLDGQAAAKVLVRHGGGTGQQIAQVVGQIHIDAVDQQLVGEVAVGAKREITQQEVTQGVGAVTLGQQIGVHHIALGLGHLAAVQQQPAVAVNVLGQGHIHAHQHGRPDDGMEPHDLLADKMHVSRPESLVVAVGVLIVHEAQGGGVVEQGIDPDVDDVLGVEVDGDAPLETSTGDAEVLQARIDEVVHHLVDAGTGQQEVGVDQQVTHAVGVLGQAEEVSLFLSIDDRTAAVRAAAGDQLALGPEALTGGAVLTLVGALVDVALFVHLFKDLLDGGNVIIVGGTDKAVVADVHQFPQVLDALGAFDNVVDELLRGDASLFCLQLDLLAVLVGAGQELDFVALQALVAGHGVGGHGAIGMADVQLIAGVIDRRCDVEFFLIHDSLLITNRVGVFTLQVCLLLKPDGCYAAGFQRVAAKHLGAVDEEFTQVLVPLDEAQLGAAQDGHIAALLFQVVHSTAELGHVGAATLLDVIVDDRHDVVLVVAGGGGPLDARIAAGDLVGLCLQGAVGSQDAQLSAACSLGIGHGQAGHVQHRHRQRLGQAVVEIVGGVAGDSNDRSAVVHQAETVLLHDGEGIVLAFAHDERRAVRRGRAGGNDDVNMILVTGCGGVVDQHLVQVAAGGRPQPTQDAQNFFMGVLRQFFLRRGAPLLITVFLFIIKRSGEICKMLI